tara:strand:- start:301 stop:663 length:363 start_codon:yes stop_codon:yes gene_type:complete
MALPDEELLKRPDGGLPPLDSVEAIEAVERDEHVKLDRANQAASILNNPLFDQAFQAVEQELIDFLKQSKPEEAPDVQRTLKLLDLVRASLTEHIRTGQLASHALNGLRKKKSWYSNRRA